MTRKYFEFQIDRDGTPFATASLEVLDLWYRCGKWTARHDSNGLVTQQCLAENPHRQEALEELVEAGIWTSVPGGYKMEYGPSTDWPLPMWRYGTTPPQNGLLFEVIPEPDA